LCYFACLCYEIVFREERACGAHTGEIKIYRNTKLCEKRPRDRQEDNRKFILDKRVKKAKVKISLLQAVEAHRVVRGQGSHIS
jgi:hypothetical protein